MTSILVRKFCQPVLDQAGYPMFHATISDDYVPTLQIYTTCGKPFAVIHGVRFSRRKPTVAECEYSAVLLQDWLKRHAKDFENYVDMYTEFHSLEKPTNLVHLGDDVTLQVDSGKAIAQLKRPYQARDSLGQEYTASYVVQFDPYTRKITDVEWSSPVTLSEITTMLKIPVPYLKKARTKIEDLRYYHECRKRFEEARSTLSSCKI